MINLWKLAEEKIRSEIIIIIEHPIKEMDQILPNESTFASNSEMMKKAGDVEEIKIKKNNPNIDRWRDNDWTKLKIKRAIRDQLDIEQRHQVIQGVFLMCVTMCLGGYAISKGV